ncbi:MAG: hypothetical protein ACI35S_06360 [Anaeroplasma sp.]
MNTHRCKSCNTEFELNDLNLTTRWYIDEQGKYKNTGYCASCPECGEKEMISFMKLPFKSKLRFIKGWLGTY